MDGKYIAAKKRVLDGVCLMWRVWLCGFPLVSDELAGHQEAGHGALHEVSYDVASEDLGGPAAGREIVCCVGMQF
eukprot:1183269-Prorocentrum_minimum.AAC.7